MSNVPKPHVLVVDDDVAVRQLVDEYLGQNDFRVSGATGGAELMAAFRAQVLDLVLLDLRLRGEDGMQLLRQLRAESQIPVIILTGRAEEADRVMGLELGADDYLAKPYEPRELLARLRAILRRGGRARDSADSVLRFGRLEIDLAARVVQLDDAPRELTSHQFNLLVALAQNAGRVLSRDALMDLAKGERLESFDRSIDVHMSRIRAAIEDDPKRPRRVITVRGAGYVFAKAQD